MTDGSIRRDGPLAVVIGPMGAGKTTVGLALADRLGVTFVDTDDEIVTRTGRTIPEIFAADGEKGFRAIESEVVADVLTRTRGVVALGGGAVTIAAVRERLAAESVVALSVSPAAGYARAASPQRPLLDPSSGDPEARYRDLMEARTPLYVQVATITVDTTGESPTALADTICQRLGLPDGKVDR